MCLAHVHVMIVWVGGAILGLWLLRAILCGLGRVARGVFRVLGRGAGDAGGDWPPRPAAWSCTEARCGHVNPADARFCARCGRPLSGKDVDDYG